MIIGKYQFKKNSSGNWVCDQPFDVADVLTLLLDTVREQDVKLAIYRGAVVALESSLQDLLPGEN